MSNMSNMSSLYRNASILALVLVISGLLGAAPAQAEKTFEHSDGASTVLSNDPVAAIETSELDEATQALLLELVAEARTYTNERERFIATTEAFTREAVEATGSTSFDVLENILLSYHASLIRLTKFEWEIKPHLAKKCNASFDCVWALGVCVIITWSDGNGSGGINCISQAHS